MLQTFSKYKKEIDLKNEELSQELIKLKIPWARDFFQNIAISSQKGKGIRGSLVLFIIESFNRKINNDVLHLALALEYYHNALLIHDDIMDHDNLRRGLPTAHYRYQLLAKRKGVKDCKDFGNSMAICLGDASIFAAQFFISKIKNLDNKNYRRLLELLGEEFIKVGLGQAQDLAFTHYSDLPSSQEVLEMYKYKTARYTFSLPLMAGAMLAGKDRNTIKSLDKLGLALGFIFQLSDDNLSLYGNSQKTGKSIGNDIRENKKTLYRVILNEKANRKDQDLVENIFKKGNVNIKDIELIRKLIIKYEVNSRLESLMDHYEKKAVTYMSKLKIEKKFLRTIKDLITFLKLREK
jgi:geranylgeranyl diphosphate synthase, type I